MGAPSGIVFPALGVTNVVYRDETGRLHELWQKGSESGTSNLTYLARTNQTNGQPDVIHRRDGASTVALYRGKDDHVYSLYWSTGTVGCDSLSLTARAPNGRRQSGRIRPEGRHKCRDLPSRRQAPALAVVEGIGSCQAPEDITPAGAPAAAGDPAPFINTNTGDNIVVYRGTDGHIHGLYWSTGAVGHDNLTGVAGAPTAAGDPVAYYTSHNDEHQVTYRGADGHIYELWWRGIEPVRHWDVTAHAGAPLAASDPVAYYSAGTNTKHYIYRSADDHLHELWVIPGGLPTHVDITLEARAPLATDKPAAFVVAGPDTHHAVYRGTDGQIHEIRWTSPAPRSTYAGPPLRPQTTGVGATNARGCSMAHSSVAPGALLAAPTHQRHKVAVATTA